MQTKKLKIISFNTLRQVLISVFAMLIPFLVITYSEKEIWGEFVTLLLFTLIATQFINWGNKEYLLRGFSLTPSQINTTFTNVLITRLPLVLLFLIIGYYCFKLEYSLYIFIWLFGRFLIHSFDVLVIYEKKFNASIFIEVVCFIIFLIAFYYFKPNLNLYVLIILYSLYQLIKGIGYLLLFNNYVKFDSIKFDTNYYKISFWFFLLSVLGFLTSKVDVYIVDYFLDNKALADYQIINSLLVFVMSISAFIYIPFTKNIYRINKDVISKTKQALTILGIIIVPISIIVIHFIIKYFLNSSFSIYFYVIAFFYVLPSFIYGIDIVELFKKKQEKRVVLYLFLGIILNSITTSILLHNNFGTTGAILGATSSQVLILILLKANSIKK